MVEGLGYREAWRLSGGTFITQFCVMSKHRGHMRLTRSFFSFDVGVTKILLVYGCPESSSVLVSA